MFLENDLRAIDKKLLIQAGEKITRKKLEHVSGMPGKITYQPVKDTWLMNDLILTFNDKRYTNILYPQDINQKIIRSASRLKIPEKIMAELAFMKKLSPYTYHHILIIAVLAAKISFDHSIKCVFSHDMALLLSLFHDIGKSRIPLSILDKTTPITVSERKVLSSHPLIGYGLLHYYFGNRHRRYAYSSYEHHERLDGSGYPRGIKTLNKYSQLIGVVDTLDALISERPYRSRPFTLRAAIDFLLEEAEKGKFNKSLVRTLIIYSRRENPGAKIIIGEKGRDKEPEDNCYGKTVND
ncbi:MAG TPA: HD domain-containing phosphohydrolase [Smithella sp.]|nr:HD domain-containing phosphohydrolase [Smithella sp.]